MYKQLKSIFYFVKKI